MTTVDLKKRGLWNDRLKTQSFFSCVKLFFIDRSISSSSWTSSESWYRNWTLAWSSSTTQISTGEESFHWMIQMRSNVIGQKVWYPRSVETWFYRALLIWSCRTRKDRGGDLSIDDICCRQCIIMSVCYIEMGDLSQANFLRLHF